MEQKELNNQFVSNTTKKGVYMNRITLIGNITTDLELKTTSNGGTMLNFTIVTSNRWTDKKTEEKKELSQFHKVVAFGRDADLVSQYYKRGDKIYIEGEVRYETYENKDGNKVYSTKIYMNKLEFTSNRKNSNDNRQEQEENTQNQQQNYNRNQYQQRNTGNGNRQQMNSGNQGKNYNNKNQNQPKPETRQFSGGRKSQSQNQYSSRENRHHEDEPHPNYEFGNNDSSENDDKIPF